MAVSYEATEKNKGTLTFTIEKEKIQSELDHAFNRVKKDLNIPGFRKGKVSRKVFDQQFGESALYQDVLNALLPEAYESAVKEADVAVVAQPTFDTKNMPKDSDWTIEAHVITKPEVKLGDYKGLSVSVEESKEVTDKDIDEKIDRERQNLAELVVKSGPSEKGDTVVIDFVGSIDGVVFDGGKGENHALELGSGQFIPGFEDQLIGAKSGDHVSVEVTFPEDYQAADLAGEDAVFATTVHEVKAKEVPALDDELAKDLDSDVDTLDALKEKYKKELAAAKEIAYDNAVETAALQAAVDNATIVELPEEMVEEEVRRSLNEFFGNIQRQGISPEVYYQITGSTEADLRAQYQEEADKRTRTNLVLEAIVAAEGLEGKASKEELEAELNELSTTYNMPVDQIRTMISDEMLQQDLAIKKAIELITSSATVK